MFKRTFYIFVNRLPINLHSGKFYITVLLTTTIATIIIPGCSNIGAGFAGYEKPNKRSNKYFSRHFKLTNPKLKIGRKYIDFDNRGLNAINNSEYSFFIFYDNGFVLHNSEYMKDSNGKQITTLDYKMIYSEDVGSYSLKGDSIFWGTRRGYKRKKFTNYYSGIITDSGIHVLSANDREIKFFRLD